jgi:hypothetical protein
MKRLLLLSALFLSSLSIAHAQFGLYAGYTASKLDVAHTDWVYGPTFGAYYDRYHFPVLNFGLDARVSLIDSSRSTQVTSGLIGPRAVLHLPAVPIRPYAEGLVGVAQAQYGQGIASVNSTDIAYGFAAGVDLHILPCLDWRVLDYTYTRLEDTDTSSQKSITTGLVLRIPLS